MTTRASDTSQHVRFPIVESFTHSTPANPHWKLLGSARLNDGSLELTPNARSRAGTAVLDEPFPSTLGVTIDFDYSCEGGGSRDSPDRLGPWLSVLVTGFSTGASAKPRRCSRD